MYDLSSKFNTFYSSNVVLSQAVQAELYDKKDLNIQRLKDGLKEYNEENGTSYSVVETCVQGASPRQSGWQRPLKSMCRAPSTCSTTKPMWTIKTPECCASI